MTEQILSQEEIDALLSSIEDGDVNLAASGNKEQIESAAKPYDLTSQNTMLREQFNALEEVYDRFEMFLQNTLASLLQKVCEINLVSSNMVKYGEFIAAFSNPASLNLFSMDPLIGTSLFVIEPEMVFALIDCMFGGEGKSLSSIREFTSIEKKMMYRFAGEVLKDLEKAWDIVYPVKLFLKSIETKPEFVHIAASNDLMINNEYSITWGDFSGSIYIATPYLMLEPIKDKLSTIYMMGKNTENAWRFQIQELLKETSVEVIGELGRNVYTVGDILKLEINDVLKFNTGPDDHVAVNVEGVTKFQGLPGVVKGNRAVQIKSVKS